VLVRELIVSPAAQNAAVADSSPPLGSFAVVVVASLPDELLSDELLSDELLPDELLPDELLSDELLSDELLSALSALSALSELHPVNATAVRATAAAMTRRCRWVGLCMIGPF